MMRPLQPFSPEFGWALATLERPGALFQPCCSLRPSPCGPRRRGPVSKQFTAAAALLLALDGKLSLDDDIRKYMPELPGYGHTVTIRHLINHLQRGQRRAVAAAAKPNQVLEVEFVLEVKLVLFG